VGRHHLRRAEGDGTGGVRPAVAVRATSHPEATCLFGVHWDILVKMRNLYREKRWLELRERVLKRDEFRCVNCCRSPEDTASMQAHHRRYLPGRFPWEYELTDLETLCQGCHAETHGKIKPSTGWIQCDELDLGARDGECDLCKTQIRYVYTIWHPDWPESYEVGCECCDRMTGLSMSRREVFVKSPRWKRFKRAAYRNHKGHAVGVFERDGFKVIIDGRIGQHTYHTMEEAMKRAFDVIESGLFDKWIAQHSPAIDPSA
jgi:5-methylcytosine-specific restriction endonuclease McrA